MHDHHSLNSVILLMKIQYIKYRVQAHTIK